MIFEEDLSFYFILNKIDVKNEFLIFQPMNFVGVMGIIILKIHSSLNYLGCVLITMI